MLLAAEVSWLGPLRGVVLYVAVSKENIFVGDYMIVCADDSG